jgi:4-hydroxybenzoate polyprenyltransferase
MPFSFLFLFLFLFLILAETCNQIATLISYLLIVHLCLYSPFLLRYSPTSRGKLHNHS